MQVPRGCCLAPLTRQKEKNCWRSQSDKSVIRAIAQHNCPDDRMNIPFPKSKTPQPPHHCGATHGWPARAGATIKPQNPWPCATQDSRPQSSRRPQAGAAAGAHNPWACAKLPCSVNCSLWALLPFLCIVFGTALPPGKCSGGFSTSDAGKTHGSGPEKLRSFRPHERG